MFEVLHLNLIRLEECYQQGVEITNELFATLKKEEIKSLPSISSKQTASIMEIKTQREKMGSVVKDIAESNNIKEYRIQNIVAFVKPDEKEEILDISKRIMVLENELQCSLQRNELYLAAMMDFSESVINSAVMINENENEGTQLFLDQKF